MSKIAVFAQIARLIPREIVNSIARKYKSDRYCKGLDTWTHLMSWLLALLADFNSLRDICNNMRGMQGRLQHLGITRAPSRNALSHQNRERSWEVFRAIYMALHKYLRQQLLFERRISLPEINDVLLLDSSTVTLCLSLFPWAKYKQEKGAIKLHALLSLMTWLPLDIHVSDGKKPDNMGAYGVFPNKRNVIVADRGYVDSELWYDWDSNEVTFVVRFKKDVTFRRIKELEQPDEGEENILIDEIIKLDGEDTKVKYSKPLRRIAVYRPYDASRRPHRRKEDEEEQPEDEHRYQVIELITNNMEWDAGVVSKLYLARWEIETFFKFIKQRLNITTFLGTSENAVRTQIWVAMIAALLLVYLKKLCGKNWTTSGLASSVRANLMSTYDLFAWLRRQYDVANDPAELCFNSS